MISAFLAWLCMGAVFIGLGIYALISKSPVRFWNIQQKIEVTDIKKYNRVMAKMWILSAVLFIALGIPLLLVKQNSAWAVISILGIMFWAIGLMVVYTFIEKKYRIIGRI
ncbi:MAG: hypothetical protein HFH35_11850 [Eubacterium sp.]|nr:hypothetical protein [Eubacterium sp.]